jgi:hypothetical protein
MTAPRTRLDEATSDFERDMLAAWADEQPSSRARDRALALAGGVAVAGAGAGAAPAAVGGAHLLKWIVTVTILAGGAVAAPFVLERTSSHPSSPVATTEAPRPAAAGPTLAPATGTATATATAVAVAPQVPASAPTPLVEPAPSPPPIAQTSAPKQAAAPSPLLPLVVAAASATAPAQGAPAPDPSGRDTRSAHALGEQVALVDRARSALGAGDASLALRLADEYDARFPGGALAPEVAGLRVQAIRMRQLLDAQ